MDVSLWSLIGCWRWLRKDEEGLERRIEEGVEGKVLRRVGEGIFIKWEIGPAQGCSHSEPTTLANQNLRPTYNELTGLGERAPSQRNGIGFWCKGSLMVQGRWC